MTLLCSCKFFCDLEDIAMLPEHRGARLFIIDTALQQINFLNACKVDLEMILDPEIIQNWMHANDGSEVLDVNYFDFYKQNFGELGDEVQDDSPQHGGVGGDGGPTPGEASMPAAPASTAAAPAVAAHGASGAGGGASFSTGATTGTSLSLWEYLGREPPDPADSDEKLEWFRDEVNSSLNQIRDEVLDSFRDRLDLPVYYLRIQTEQVCAALIRMRYASLTCPQTTGSSFSVLDPLHYEVAQRLAAAEDLHSRLQDSNETLLFHSILRKLNTGELECVEEWIGTYRDGEMKEEPPSVSTGIHTRNERAEYSVADERKETIRERMAWALDMLRLLRLKVRPCKRERFFSTQVECLRRHRSQGGQK